MEHSHVFEVLKKEAAIVIRDASDLIPALISEEAELLLLEVLVSCLLGKHKVEGSFLV